MLHDRQVLSFAFKRVIGQFYVSHVKIVMTLSVTLHFAIMVIFSSVMSQDQRRSDKQLASSHVSSRPMRSLYFPSCFLQNLGRKICIRRKINREKTFKCSSTTAKDLVISAKISKVNVIPEPTARSAVRGY